MPGRRYVVTGRVQGVSYRAAACRAARALGLTGWVRNRRDGSVEAMIAGDAAQIAEMLAWSRIGPGGAAVDVVMVESASGNFSGFDLLPTA